MNARESDKVASAILEQVNGLALSHGSEVDIRLQINLDKSWAVHTGDSQYDLNHKGFWGSETTTYPIPDMAAARHLAESLISQAMDSVLASLQ